MGEDRGSLSGASRRERARGRRALVGLVTAIVFGLAFTWFTTGDRFPWFYHPDEPGKVEQVLTGNWNFNHPMLLLTGTAGLKTLAAIPSDPQKVAVLGRTVAAGLAAVAVIAFGLATGLGQGMVVGLLTAVFLLANPQLYELAHYFKEDTALAAGIGVTLLAMAWFERRPEVSRAILLGTAVGTAVSGKYVGALLIAPAALTLMRAKVSAGGRGRYLAGFVAGLAAALLVFDAPALSATAHVGQSLGKEMHALVNGHQGLTRRVPHAVYFNTFTHRVTPFVWPLLAAGVYAWWRNRRQAGVTAAALATGPFLFMALLCFFPQTNDRYFLPVTVGCYALAATGAQSLPALVEGKFPRHGRRVGTALVVTLVLLALVADVRSTSTYRQAFGSDDRVALLQFLEGSVPPDARLLADPTTRLQRLLDSRSKGPGYHVVAASLDRYAGEVYPSLAAAEADGVRYVVVSSSDYERFRLKTLHTSDGDVSAYGQARRFYEDLFHEGTLLWKRPRRKVIYLHPGLEVYRVGPANSP